MSYGAYLVKNREHNSSFDLNEEWVTKLVPNIEEIFNLNGVGILFLHVEVIEKAINEGIISDPSTICVLRKDIKVTKSMGYFNILYICT